MRLWLTPSNEISLRDQIVRQVTLAILSGELAPGARLPSVRALARRFGLHANTVSAAYRQLHDEQLVTSRHGSGVFVQRLLPPSAKTEGAAESRLEDLLARVVGAADKLKLTPEDLIVRLQAAMRRPARIVLVESDPELARIVLFEIESAGRQIPDLCTLPVERFVAELRPCLEGRLPAVMPSKAAAARQALGSDAPLLVLEISAAAPSFASHLPQSREHLVAVVSHWPRFLDFARGMLISAGFHADSILPRDTRLPGWDAGLVTAAAVLCDAFTRTLLPSGTSPIVFSLLPARTLQAFARQADCDSP